MTADNISCTAVLLSISNQSSLAAAGYQTRTKIVECQLYQNLQVPMDCISYRSGAFTVGVDSMILAIKHFHIESSLLLGSITAPPPVIIGDIILGDAGAPAVDLATTRTPTFDDWNNIQNPTTGFRKLIRLEEVHRGETRPTKAAFDPAWDLIAMHVESSQLSAREFKDAWAPAGINFSRHFFLIFLHWDTAGGRSGTRYSPMSSSRGSSPLRSSLLHASSSMNQSHPGFLHNGTADTYSGHFISRSSSSARLITSGSASVSQSSSSPDMTVDLPSSTSESGCQWDQPGVQPEIGQESNMGYTSSSGHIYSTTQAVPSNFIDSVSLNSPASSHQGK